MQLRSLQERWKRAHSPDGHLSLWDAESAAYAARPLPDFAADGFLKIVAASGALTPDATLFDVGCGAGLYTLAAAPRVAFACGSDLSPAMIEAARSRAQALGITNVRFDVEDWAQESEHSDERFDVGFAHMTPAVGDYAGFRKFLDKITRHGFFEHFVNRRHPAMTLAFEIAGLANTSLWHDADVYLTLECLISSGLKPRIFYRPAEWQAAESPDRLADFCMRRIRLKATQLTEGDLQRIRAELLDRLISTCGADGLAPCPQTAPIVTLDWAM